MRFYVTQYGFYWRLTEAQLRAACQGILDGKGYILEDLGAKQIKHKPKRSMDVTVFKMLDWREDQARLTLAELDAGATFFSNFAWIWGA